MAESIIREKSYAFALKVLKLSKVLKKENEFELATQLLRSGTSIGANVEEALAGQSQKDFIAKMFISLKEARETHYWLRLLGDSSTISSKRVEPLLSDVEELKRILFRIVHPKEK